MRNLRKLDAYPKINKDFYRRTISGGIITLVSAILMLILFIFELSTSSLLFFFLGFTPNCNSITSCPFISIFSFFGIVCFLGFNQIAIPLLFCPFIHFFNSVGLVQTCRFSTNRLLACSMWLFGIMR